MGFRSISNILVTQDTLTGPGFRRNRGDVKLNAVCFMGVGLNWRGRRTLSLNGMRVDQKKKLKGSVPPALSYEGVRAQFRSGI